MTVIRVYSLKIGYLIECSIDLIGDMIQGYWDINPTNNSSEVFENDTFQMAAYDWGENRDWNFKWRDVEISWYKCMGRCVEINRDISVHEIKDMVIECLNSIETRE